MTNFLSKMLETEQLLEDWDGEPGEPQSVNYDFKTKKKEVRDSILTLFHFQYN